VVRALTKYLPRKGRQERTIVYFSGHAVAHQGRTYLIATGYNGNIPGPGCVDFAILLDLVNRSRVDDVVVILDCCHAGASFDDERVQLYGEYSVSLLRDGVVVLAGAERDENAFEIDGRSLFTELLVEGLEGGAADIFGHVTASSLYAYVDERLGEFELQRPIFKANVSRLLSIRRSRPRITRAELRSMAICFPEPTEPYFLSPEHEGTEEGHDPVLVERFQHLKNLRDVGLVFQDPNYTDFWSTAMASSWVKLTEKGRHVWQRNARGLT
jgi:hypothetical protein